MHVKKSGKSGRKTAAGILAAAVLMMTMTACGTDTEEGTKDTMNATEATDIAEDTLAEEATAISGKIVSIEGNIVTIATMEQPVMLENQKTGMPERPAGQEGEEFTMPDGQEGREGQEPGTLEEAGRNALPIPESGGGGNDQAPAEEGGKRPRMEMNYTGVEISIEVSDTTLYTVNGENGRLSDLQADDIVTVILQGSDVISITAGKEIPA